ncbi:MAG: DUF1854 domain-containing protein [Armatimonadota bacterium]
MADSQDEREETAAPSEAGASWDQELARLEIIDASRVRIRRDEFRRLHVVVDGKDEHVDLKPAPVFPISGVADFVSFLDEKGKEAVLVRDLGGLDEESRAALAEELGRAYFVPKIISIYEIEDAHGAARWEVETDRGFRIFDIRDREDVRVLGRGRLILQDADGNRYEIEDMSTLDERSRKLLDGQV